MDRYINSFIIILFCVCLNEQLNPFATQLQKPAADPAALNPKTQAQKSTVDKAAPNQAKNIESSIKPKKNDKRWTKSEKIPLKFDAREQWKMCSIIRESMVYNGQFENSWAVVTSSALADRICIATNGRFNEHISVEELMKCFYNRYDRGLGMNYENIADKAWEYYQNNGALSESHFKYYDVCPPSGNSKVDYSRFRRKITNVYTLDSIDEIKKDIFTYGPVSAIRRRYDDEMLIGNIMYYQNRGDSTGTYKLEEVKIIGWGKEGAFEYWLCVQSLSVYWEDKGVLKISMGKSEPNIGGKVIAGEPFIDKKSLNFFQKWFCR